MANARRFPPLFSFCFVFLSAKVYVVLMKSEGWLNPGHIRAYTGHIGAKDGEADTENNDSPH